MRSSRPPTERRVFRARSAQARAPRASKTITEDAVDHESVHECGVDTDADAVIDVAIRVRFSPVRDKQQTADVRLVTGSDAAADFRWTGRDGIPPRGGVGDQRAGVRGRMPGARIR
ncbi:hypothetical protein ACFYZB_45710 [Streptomyces sp. NPDC001852]|uniref:hypothetical protein n=1 Tax=Streptomyces sp. NPDC001852 TaxID=3364619 RepID=UPI0036CAAF9C